jgi:predicted ArsR family transcriptional regulator
VHAHLFTTLDTVQNNEGRKSSPKGPFGPRAGAAVRPLSASPTAILDTLRGQSEPLTQAALVRVTGLHPNTVREHLETLVHRGLVARSRAEPKGRGRPAWLYASIAAEPDTSEYAGLVAALASAIARNSQDPRADAILAGEDWGHDLARNRGARPTSPESAREHVAAMFDDLGFQPDQEPAAADVLRLTRCPLLEAARRHPDVVCGVHLGIARGALAAYGADPAGSDVFPFAEPGACLLVVPPLVRLRG